MAPSKKNPYGTHDGRPVISTGVVIRKTGDGLSEAMKTEPRVISQGETVYLVIEATCVDVHYPVEDRHNPTEGGVQRLHVLDAGTSAFLDEELVRNAIKDQREANLQRQEREDGVMRLGYGDNQELRGAHLLGDHDEDPHPNCPACLEQATT